MRFRSGKENLYGDKFYFLRESEWSVIALQTLSQPGRAASRLVDGDHNMWEHLGAMCGFEVEESLSGDTHFCFVLHARNT